MFPEAVPRIQEILSTYRILDAPGGRKNLGSTPKILSKIYLIFETTFVGKTLDTKV